MTNGFGDSFGPISKAADMTWEDFGEGARADFEAKDRAAIKAYALREGDRREKSHGNPYKGKHERSARTACPDRTAKETTNLCTSPDDFQNDRNGIPYPNQRNIRLAVARLGHELRHDTFADRLLLDGSFLDDPAMARLYLEVEERFRFRPGREFFWMVVEDAARQNPFHPVRDYLNSLKWDGVERLDTWLIKYAGAADTLFVRAVGRLVLVAAVRRVRSPGCKFDEMLILESEQGLEKSTALSVLAVRDAWFSDDLPLSADTKRQIEALSGRWIVEASELQGMRRGDVEHLKAFLSRTMDRARMAYGRRETEARRQCIVIGTTNSTNYLKDSTGNRRYWPVRIHAFDLNGLRKDRDQLWAEAAHREAANESIRLDPALYGVAAEAQDERRVEDPFVVRLREVLGDLKGKIRMPDAWKILEVPPGQQNQGHSARLGEAMRELQWQRTKLRFGGPPEWCYARGNEIERRVQISIAVDEDGPRICSMGQSGTGVR